MLLYTVLYYTLLVCIIPYQNRIDLKLNSDKNFSINE